MSLRPKIARKECQRVEPMRGLTCEDPAGKRTGANTKDELTGADCAAELANAELMRELAAADCMARSASAEPIES